jgi:outer membrane protein assembly factor BamA
MKRCLFGALLYASLLAPLVFSQDVIFPLETLRIQGNSRIPAEKIIALTGLNPGSPVQKADFDAARARLLATGAFASVGYEYKPSASKTGYAGVFEVVEVDQLFAYRFEDLPVSEEVLREGLRRQEPLLEDRIPGTAEVLNRYAKAIEQIAKTPVVGKLSNDVPGQLTIIFRPPGARASVAEVRFTGNQVLPSPLLINTLSGVAIGIAYNEATLRVLLDSSVRPLYDARGRIRVTFPTITVERSPKADVDGVVVTVTVNEGPVYSLGNIRFAGISAGDAQEVQRAANFQANDFANFDDINAGLERVYKRFKSKGYLRVAGKIERNIHDDEHTVDLVVNIDPGQLYSMGKLEITGLDITSEPAIRKMWAIKTGEPFQPEYPQSFLDDVRGQGLFDNLGKTEPETKIDEKTKIVDVTLHFAGTTGKKEERRLGGPRQ